VAIETVVIDKASPFLDTVPQKVRERLALIVGQRTDVLRQGVIAKVRSLFTTRSTGRLAGSIQEETSSTADGSQGRVFTTGVPYARIHEYGGQTRPHVILPEAGGVLAFMGNDGKMVFTRKVNHPGSKFKERSYARSTLAEQRADIEAALNGAATGLQE
jgi:hypothetical protein